MATRMYLHCKNGLRRSFCLRPERRCVREPQGGCPRAGEGHPAGLIARCSGCNEATSRPLGQWSQYMMSSVPVAVQVGRQRCGPLAHRRQKGSAASRRSPDRPADR
jgi:hypothetical protein